MGGDSLDSRVRQLRGRCGFSFEVAPELRRSPAPEEHAVELLRLYDPARAFVGP